VAEGSVRRLTGTNGTALDEQVCLAGSNSVTGFETLTSPKGSELVATYPNSD